ncbi:MAG TPA: hypothetical protein VFG69_11035, partial [Nannocystaceae bacterium]|nr:hypothetical protein [Nannocystaceae bacterium]
RHEESGAAIVIREPYVAFVIGDKGERKSDPAFDIATMDPMRSLAAAKGYKKGTGGLAPSDALFYMDGGALSQALLDAQGEAPPVPSNWARDELAKARQANATPERIKELEQQVREVDEQNARSIKRQQGERALFEQLFGGIQASIWTADAKPGGIVGQGTTTFAADSPMLLAIENGTGSPPLARALDGKPLFMVTGKANIEQLVRVADLFAQADGTSWSEVAAEMARETGIDPERDLKPLVTGQVGFAVTREGDDGTVVDDPKQIGGALYVEVHDPKGAQAVLAKAAKAIEGKDDVKVRKVGDGWVIDTKEWRKLYIDIQGPHVVVSTDAKLVGRIAGGKAGTITKRADGAALAAASLQDSAAGMLFDPELSMMFFLGRSKFPMPTTVESPEDAKVPKSRAWKAKERELQALTKKLDKAQADRERIEMAAIGAVIRPWGSFGASARRDGNSIVVQGGWFVRSETIATALSRSLEAISKLDESRTHSDEASGLFEQRMKLENELMEIRRADLEKFRTRKSR